MCYSENGKTRILESVLNGVSCRDFDDTLTDKYPVYVYRLTRTIDMSTQDAEKFVEKLVKKQHEYYVAAASYPIANLGVLAILLLFKKFTKTERENKKMYGILCLLALSLMEIMENMKQIKADKKPMTCSQFVAQCFSEAGKDFNFNFSKLVVDYDTTGGSDKISFIEFLIKAFIKKNTGARGVVSDKSFDIDTIPNIPDKTVTEVLGNPDKVIEEFMGFMEHPVPESTGARGVLSDAIVSLLLSPLKDIALCVYTMITGEKTPDLAKALNYLKDLNIAKKSQLSSDTARNFFVAPEDIYSNCTNMTKIGILVY
jgi:hypothetical protein